MTEPTTDEVPAAVTPWPDLPYFPPASAIPQDSAVEAAAVAVTLRSGVLAYREAVRPVLDADGVFTPGPVEDCAEVRRRVGMVADTLIRRALSPESVVIAGHASRVAERVAGLTLRATPAVLIPRPWDVFGSAADRVRAMSAATDDEFDAAVGMCAARGDVSFDAVSAMLDRGNLSDAEREQAETIGRLADQGRSAEQVAEALALDVDTVNATAVEYGIAFPSATDPGVWLDPVSTVAAVVEHTRTAGGCAESVAPEMIATLDRAQCADWSRELWVTAKHVLQLRARLEARGAGR